MSCHPSRQTREELHQCEYAHALRPSLNGDIMDEYLIGPIEPERIAILIHHNNTLHDGSTRQQMGHLYNIMDARARNPLIQTVYDQKLMMKLVEKKLDQLEHEAKMIELKRQAALAPAQIEVPSVSNVTEPAMTIRDAIAGRVSGYAVDNIRGMSVNNRNTNPIVQNPPVVLSAYRPRKRFFEN